MRTPSSTAKRKRTVPTVKAIRTAVASSTAIETSRTTIQVKSRLRAKSGRARKVDLAG